MRFRTRGEIVYRSFDGKTWHVYTIARTPQRALEIARGEK